MVMTSRRNSQHFPSHRIVPTDVKRPNKVNSRHNPIQEDRLQMLQALPVIHRSTTSWEISAIMGLQEARTAVLLHPVAVWARQGLDLMVVIHVTAWPVLHGNDLQPVQCQHLRRPQGAQTASLGSTRWTIIPIGGHSSTNC